MVASANKLIKARGILQEGTEEFLTIFRTLGLRKRGIVSLLKVIRVAVDNARDYVTA
jgi:hypothetical protein